MKTYDNLTDGLQTVLLMYQKGYVNHIGFLTSKDKIQALGEKWEEEFGTRLPAHRGPGWSDSRRSTCDRRDAPWPEGQRDSHKRHPEAKIELNH